MSPRPHKTVTPAKLAYHSKQLRKYFARANDKAFLELIWAVDALQSGRENEAKLFLKTYPKAAVASSSIHSPMGIHRWELETLLIQLGSACADKRGNLCRTPSRHLIFPKKAG